MSIIISVSKMTIDHLIVVLSLTINNWKRVPPYPTYYNRKIHIRYYMVIKAEPAAQYCTMKQNCY